MTTIYYSRARERALQTIDSPRAGAWVVVMTSAGETGYIPTLVER